MVPVKNIALINTKEKSIFIKQKIQNDYIFRFNNNKFHEIWKKIYA